jgi:hypothetical protein
MSSSLSANHQSHMNIVDSRKQAIKFITDRKGITVYNGSNRVTKIRMKTAIKKGLFDGYYYSHNKDLGMIIITLNVPSNFPHKIGV